ncbi:DoxX family membrane protein [Georgenia yuyongxinii]|uniref:DoxX family membrane protein n=1 Tax=Georgenia yuyongxinii TaxID=2589797 RepID=UPI001CB72E6F|nr:DoxX family membrane protein [Georgenia yuyongxinii]
MAALTDAGLLALRSGVGGVLIAHGCQKLFGWFGGHGLKGTGGYFESIGFAPGIPNAVAGGVGERAAARASCSAWGRRSRGPRRPGR